MNRMQKILANAGCANELEFWQQYSGLGSTKGTWVDHMVQALGKNGYSGTPGDMYRAWITDMGGMIDAPLSGLTFFKNYTSLGNGNFNANLSVGVGTGTYTSTSGTPTMTGGYNATVANDDVLSYPISGNRTAAQETIVIKLQMDWDLSNDGIQRCLIYTQTKLRNVYKSSASATWRAKPNETDNGVVTANPTSMTTRNTDYTFVMSCQHSSPYVSTFVNGGNRVDYTAGDWTTNSWGESFFVGCENGGSLQFEGKISKIAFFNKPLSLSDIVLIYNLL